MSKNFEKANIYSNLRVPNFVLTIKFLDEDFITKLSNLSSPTDEEVAFFYEMYCCNPSIKNDSRRLFGDRERYYNYLALKTKILFEIEMNKYRYYNLVKPLETINKINIETYPSQNKNPDVYKKNLKIITSIYERFRIEYPFFIKMISENKNRMITDDGEILVAEVRAFVDFCENQILGMQKFLEKKYCSRFREDFPEYGCCFSDEWSNNRIHSLKKMEAEFFAADVFSCYADALTNTKTADGFFLGSENFSPPEEKILLENL